MVCELIIMRKAGRKVHKHACIHIANQDFPTFVQTASLHSSELKKKKTKKTFQAFVVSFDIFYGRHVFF